MSKNSVAQPTIAEMAREAAERSRLAQGLPPRITRPDVLDRLATLWKAEGKPTA